MPPASFYLPKHAHRVTENTYICESLCLKPGQCFGHCHDFHSHSACSVMKSSTIFMHRSSTNLCCKHPRALHMTHLLCTSPMLVLILFLSQWWVHRSCQSFFNKAFQMLSLAGTHSFIYPEHYWWPCCIVPCLHFSLVIRSFSLNIKQIYNCSDFLCKFVNV
jgi:hypothetical protein